MVFHRPREVLREEYILMFSGERLQVVDLFKYLGLIFHESGGHVHMIEHRSYPARKKGFRGLETQGVFLVFPSSCRGPSL